jgi:hypothetical protein
MSWCCRFFGGTAEDNTVAKSVITDMEKGFHTEDTYDHIPPPHKFHIHSSNQLLTPNKTKLNMCLHGLMSSIDILKM